MTVSAAIWVLEHEAAWVGRNFTQTRTDNDPSAFIALYVAGSVQASVISMMPYYSISQASSSLAWQVETNVHRVRFARAFGVKVGRRAAAKFLLTRVASRLVPGVGWALFMVDAWAVGKWIGEKTNPFD